MSTGKSRDFAQANALKLRVHSNFDSAELRASWQELQDHGVASAFQHLDFIEGMARQVLPIFQASPRIFELINPSGTCLMILPLLLRAHKTYQSLEAFDLGLADYVLPLFRRDFTPTPEQMLWLRGQIKQLCPQADILSLVKVPQNFDDAANPLHLLGMPSMGVATFPRFIRTPGDVTAMHKSGLHEDYRKRLRKLVREGRDPNWLVAKTAAEAEQLFETLVKLRKNRFAALKRSDDLQNSAMHQFYLELARQGCEAGSVCLLALKFKDEIVAVQYGLVHKDRCVVIMVGAETEHWRSASPGLINFVKMVDWTIETGLQIFDLGVGELSYKKRFTTEPCALFEGHYPLTIKGRIVALTRRTRRLARTTLERHPQLNGKIRKLLSK